MWSEDHRDVLRVLADVYLVQGQVGKAVLLLEALHVLEPDHEQVAKALSYAYMRAGRPEDALALMDALLDSGLPWPENAPLLLIQSKALWALGRCREAADRLDRYQRLLASHET